MNLKMKRTADIFILTVILFFSSLKSVFPKNIDWLIEQANRARLELDNVGFSFTEKIEIKGIEENTIEGKIVFKKPDNLFIEYQNPERETIVVNSKKSWVWLPSENQVIIQSPDSLESILGVNRSVLYFFHDLNDLMKDYKVKLLDYKKKNYTVSVENDEERMVIFISDKTFIPVKIICENEMVSISFHARDIKINQNLSEDFFEFKVPENAAVFNLP